MRNSIENSGRCLAYVILVIVAIVTIYISIFCYIGVTSKNDPEFLKDIQEVTNNELGQEEVKE